MQLSLLSDLIYPSREDLMPDFVSVLLDKCCLQKVQWRRLQLLLLWSYFDFCLPRLTYTNQSFSKPLFMGQLIWECPTELLCGLSTVSSWVPASVSVPSGVGLVLSMFLTGCHSVFLFSPASMFSVPPHLSDSIPVAYDYRVWSFICTVTLLTTFQLLSYFLSYWSLGTNFYGSLNFCLLWITGNNIFLFVFLLPTLEYSHRVLYASSAQFSIFLYFHLFSLI